MLSCSRCSREVGDLDAIENVRVGHDDVPGPVAALLAVQAQIFRVRRHRRERVFGLSPTQSCLELDPRRVLVAAVPAKAGPAVDARPVSRSNSESPVCRHDLVNPLFNSVAGRDASRDALLSMGGQHDQLLRAGW